MHDSSLNFGDLVCSVVAIYKVNAKKSEFITGNSHLAMLLKFWTFLQCNTYYLKGEIMINFGLG